MDLKEAMEQRHTVRSYIDRPLPSEVIRLLAERIQKNNEAYRLHMQLITENIEAFGPLLRLILAKGVRKYIILSAPAGPTVEERLGYCGADVMLYAQTLGLNSWWVGGTFNKKGVQKNADSAGTEKIIGLIAIGYGATQGVPHKSKRPEDISHYHGKAPDWFIEGVRAVLLAPTALNRQAFQIEGDGERVSMSYGRGAFADVDLGIGKYHFEIGAEREHFIWAEHS